MMLTRAFSLKSLTGLFFAVALVLTSCAPNAEISTTHSTWNEPGNYIVSYGPIYEPYSTSIKNSYYLYDENGTQIDRVRGGGNRLPTSLATKRGIFGNFSNTFNQFGSIESIPIQKHSYLSLAETSPSGAFGVAVFNESISPEFTYSAIVINEGSVTKLGLPTVPHSLAVGEECALIVGVDPDERGTDKDLFLIRSNSEIVHINFPVGYRLDLPDFKYHHVNYLGDGRFEVLEGLEEGSVTRFRSFIVVVDEDDQLVTEEILNFSMEVPENVEAVWRLPFGENGFVDNQGNVFINRRNEMEPEKTGNIKGLNRKTFVSVYSAVKPLFGMVQGKEIAIYSWERPNEPVAMLPFERWACWDDACNVSLVTFVF